MHSNYDSQVTVNQIIQFCAPHKLFMIPTPYTLYNKYTHIQQTTHKIQGLSKHSPVPIVFEDHSSMLIVILIHERKNQNPVKTILYEILHIQ